MLTARVATVIGAAEAERVGRAWRLSGECGSGGSRT